MLIYLKDFRTKYGITQKEAAESIGIDQRQWSRYENGTNEFPLRYLKELCTKYKVSANFLLGLPEITQHETACMNKYEIRNTVTGESATVYIADKITIGEK